MEFCNGSVSVCYLTISIETVSSEKLKYMEEHNIQYKDMLMGLLTIQTTNFTLLILLILEFLFP